MPRAKEQKRPKASKGLKTLVQVRIDADVHYRFNRMCAHFGQTAAYRLRGLIVDALRDGYPDLVAVIAGATRNAPAVVEGHGVVSNGKASHVEYNMAVLPNDAKGFLPEALAEGTEFALPGLSPKMFTLGHSYCDTKGVWRLRLVEVKA